MACKSQTLICTILKSVRWGGLWQVEQRKISYYAKFAIFCFMGNNVTQLIALVMSTDDTERFFECFSVLSFCGMGILKLYSLCRKRETWLNLLAQMSYLEREQQIRDEDFTLAEYQSDGEEDEDVPNLIRNYTDNFKSTFNVLIRIYFSTAFIFIMSPFIEHAFWILLGKQPEGYPHILPGWNPLDKIHFLCYLVTVILEAVAALYCVVVHLSFDLTAMGVMIYVCGQFSSLVYQSERVGGRGKMCNLSKKRDIRAHFRISKCHRVHIQIISTIKELDQLLKNILGFYFFLATLTLCSVAVRLKTEQMSAMQLVSLLQYMCATLIQLFIYCNYGDAVFNESSIGSGRGPFGAAIWCLGPKIRREVALLGFGMMKPRRLHAGPFNTVDLPSFIQVVRAAYSYYAVLGK